MLERLLPKKHALNASHSISPSNYKFPLIFKTTGFKITQIVLITTLWAKQATFHIWIFAPKIWSVMCYYWHVYAVLLNNEWLRMFWVPKISWRVSVVSMYCQFCPFGWFKKHFCVFSRFQALVFKVRTSLLLLLRCLAFIVNSLRDFAVVAMGLSVLAAGLLQPCLYP